MAGRVVSGTICFVRRVDRCPRDSLVRFYGRVSRARGVNVKAALTLFEGLFTLQVLRFGLRVSCLRLGLSSVRTDGLLRGRGAIRTAGWFDLRLRFGAVPGARVLTTMCNVSYG